MKKILFFVLITAVVAIGAGFFGGMIYSQTKNPRNNFQNLSLEERQQRFQQAGINGSGAGRNGAGFTSGEVISKDDKSITIKMGQEGQGGSRIIFYSDTTEISKFVAGTVNDLEIGKSVTINGTANQDGSIVAQSIQIR